MAPVMNRYRQVGEVLHASDIQNSISHEAPYQEHGRILSTVNTAQSHLTPTLRFYSPGI